MSTHELTDEPQALEVGYNGKMIAVRGSYTTMILIITVFAMAILWMLWTAISTGSNTVLMHAIAEHRAANALQHGEIKQSIEDQTKVLGELRELQEEQNYLEYFASPKEKQTLQGIVQRPPRFQRWIDEERRPRR